MVDQGSTDIWARLIQRGVRDGVPVGTESSGEALLIYAAASKLENGEPALELFNRFSMREIEAIKRALDGMGQAEWYDPIARKK